MFLNSYDSYTCLQFARNIYDTKSPQSDVHKFSIFFVFWLPTDFWQSSLRIWLFVTFVGYLAFMCILYISYTKNIVGWFWLFIRLLQELLRNLFSVYSGSSFLMKTRKNEFFFNWTTCLKEHILFNSYFIFARDAMLIGSVKLMKLLDYVFEGETAISFWMWTKRFHFPI